LAGTSFNLRIGINPFFFNCLLVLLLLLTPSWGVAGTPLTLLEPETSSNKLANPLVSTPLPTNGKLGIEPFKAWVERTHPDLAQAQLKQQAAAAKRLSAQGAFDPKLINASEQKQYNANTGVGKEKDAFQTDTELITQTRSGALLGGGIRTARGDYSSSVQPAGQGGEWYAELTLPLLKNRGINPANVAEQQGLMGETQAQVQADLTRIDLLSEAQLQYYEWALAYERLQAVAALTQLAQERLNMVETRARSGDVALIDVTESQQEWKRRQRSLAKETEAFQKTTVATSLFLWDAEKAQRQSSLMGIYPEIGTTPEVAPASTEHLLVTGKIAILQGHPALKSLALGQQLAKLELKLAKNQLLPQIDLLLSPAYQSGGDGIGLAYKAGVKMSIPLRNRGARGKVQLAEVELKQIDLKTKQTLQKLFAELEKAVASVHQAYIRLGLAEEEYALAVQLQQAELRKYAAGDSSLFVLNRRERDTTDARIQVLQGLVDFQAGWVLYNRATGQV
jgi:outer membrane protein TolC